MLNASSCERNFASSPCTSPRYLRSWMRRAVHRDRWHPPCRGSRERGLGPGGSECSGRPFHRFLDGRGSLERNARAAQARHRRRGRHRPALGSALFTEPTPAAAFAARARRHLPAPGAYGTRDPSRADQCRDREVSARSLTPLNPLAPRASAPLPRSRSAPRCCPRIGGYRSPRPRSVRRSSPGRKAACRRGAGCLRCSVGSRR
jgi:hypothetical protein